MRKLLLTLCLTASCFAQEVGIPKAYKGEEGLEVTVVRYGPREKNQALVMLQGVDAPRNGKVFLTNVRETERAVEYQLDGPEERYIMRGRKSSWGNSWRYEAYAGDKRVYNLYYDETLSKAARADEVLDKFNSNPGTP